MVPGWNLIVPESFAFIRNKIVSLSLALTGGVTKVLVICWIGKVNRLLSFSFTINKVTSVPAGIPLIEPLIIEVVGLPLSIDCAMEPGIK